MNESDGRVAAACKEPESMASVVSETKELAEVVLGMTCVLNSFLFGIGPLPCDDTEKFTCMRDELCETRRMLFKAREELTKLQALIGI